jgi:hypothetical protein
MEVDFKESVSYDQFPEARALQERYEKFRGLDPGQLPGLVDEHSYLMVLDVFERAGYRKLARMIQRFAADHEMARRTVHTEMDIRMRGIYLMVRFTEFIPVNWKHIQQPDGRYIREIDYPPESEEPIKRVGRPTMRILG